MGEGGRVGAAGCDRTHGDAHAASEVVLISKFFKMKPGCSKNTRVCVSVKEHKEERKGWWRGG